MNLRTAQEVKHWRQACELTPRSKRAQRLHFKRTPPACTARLPTTNCSSTTGMVVSPRSAVAERPEVPVRAVLTGKSQNNMNRGMR